MPRDFARAQPRSRSPRSAPAPSRKGPFLSGLVLGLGVALLVWLVDHGYVSPELPWSAGQDAASVTPGKSPPLSRPRFDFYTILPEMEVVIPEEAAPRSAAPVQNDPARAPEKPVIPPAATEAGGYILQAGSFRSVGDAEALKASLALLGYEANVQRVSVNQDTYHRVRIGPFRDREAASQARARLRGSAVDTLLLRLKG